MYFKVINLFFLQKLQIFFPSVLLNCDLFFFFFGHVRVLNFILSNLLIFLKVCDFVHYAQVAFPRLREYSSTHSTYMD